MEDQVISANHGKFKNPHFTAEGAARASVAFTHPETLWFNTGTLCNIKCINCYIESSPRNDALVYINANEVSNYLDQLITYNWQIREIAFTGGEPFMNPEIIEITQRSLAAGYEVLILTNAMSPMMRKQMQQGLIKLNAAYPDKLTLRISLDHHNQTNHDLERAFQAGTGAVTVQICEAGQVVLGGGKPRRRVCRFDLGQMTQANMSGRGSSLRIHRRPRAWLI